MRLVGVIAVSFTLAAAAWAAERPSPDPRAWRVAEQVMTALGGEKAWDATRFLRFDFLVQREGQPLVRSHTWDKWTGRYRLEGTEADGTPYLVLMNINSKDGDAWRNGQKLDGPEEKKYLERGYGAWVNDTYWLLMPYKLRDPGVILTYAGEETNEVGTWDKLHLAFDNVGLTPKDQYWVWVNRATGLVDQWDFVLKGEKVPPTTYLWRGWRKVGEVMLAAERIGLRENRRIEFPVLEAPATLPDDVFTSPAPAPAASR